MENVLDKPQSRSRSVWHGSSSLNLDTSRAVMGVDGDFGRDTITLEYLEEDGEVKLEAKGINVLGDLITDNCKAGK